MACLKWFIATACGFILGVFGDNEVYKHNFSSTLLPFYNSLGLALEETDVANWVVSPVSIGSALIPAYLGSKGDTRSQIGNILGLSPNVTEAEQQLSLFQQRITDSNPRNVTWTSVNHILVNQNFHLKDDFVNSTVKKNFKIENEDFNSSLAIASKVNEWVKNATHQFIEELVTPELINMNSIMVMLNGAYFKSKWKHGFVEEYTDYGCFYPKTGNCSMVKMMVQEGEFNYYENSDTLNGKFVEIPYSNENYSMIIALPHKKDGLSEIMKKLEVLPLHSVRASMEMNDVSIKIPKFDSEFFVDLKDVLIKLGAEQAFSDMADFTNMIDTVGAKLSAVVHKSKISFSESGTEAAAASGVIPITKSSFRSEQFNANHPFAYFIVNQYNEILFQGQVRSFSAK